MLLRLKRSFSDTRYDLLCNVLKFGQRAPSLGPYFFNELRRDDFGAGEYHLMIRQGKTMLFTGTIGIGPRPGEPWPDDLMR